MPDFPIQNTIENTQRIAIRIRARFPEVQAEHRLYWYSHAIVSGRLQEAAGDDPEKNRVAAFVKDNTHLCWRDFLELDDPMKEWALGELARHVRNGDSAPTALRELADRRAISEIVIFS